MIAEREDYATFLASKGPIVRAAGFAVTAEALNPLLFDFQRHIVQWALHLGRAAIFAECGLGKSAMQIEWARHVCLHTGGAVLILTPLAVAQQMRREGEKFGVHVTVCRTQEDVRPGINVTNYERLDRFTHGAFAGVVLDESSILRNYVGKTKQALLMAFAGTRFKLCCTATPAPNDHTELGNHAEFLGVMTSGEMLTRYFMNDSTEAQNLRLKKHAERDFWRWVTSWAVCLSTPGDLGYDDDGFVLPPLQVREHIVDVDHAATQEESGQLFRVAKLSATTMHDEMRRTAVARAARVADLVASSTEPWVIWCHTNYEADAVRAALPEVVEVRGSESLETKERKLQDFSEGRTRLLLTKPSVAGFGLNWQHCHQMAFVGLSYSYEALYQALRRSWRYGQTQPVMAHIVCAETETDVLSTIHRKQEEHRAMQQAMNAAQRENLAQAEAPADARVQHAVATGEDWTLHLGDCVDIAGELEPDSIHFSLFSPPFSNLYCYTPSLRDMGNTLDDAEFFTHFGYLIRELLRVTMPGRLCAVHCKDLPKYKSRYGVSGMRDFSGDVVRAFEAARLAAGDDTQWVYHSRVTIWTDPVFEMQRTKAQRLLYKTFRTDATYSAQGAPDYVVVFRKWDPAVASAEPVLHDPESFPLPLWQRYASCVWMDINRMNVLNARGARDSEDEKHICPLQLDVIERCIDTWTNPGDLVFDPFTGVGSTGHVAVRMGRRFLGAELKPSYYDDALEHLYAAEASREQRTLFDDVAMAEAAG